MASKIKSVAIALFVTMTSAQDLDGMQMPMTKSVSTREMTHEQSLTMRKQYSINAKVMAKQRGGFFNNALKWFGLAQATIAESSMTTLDWYDEIYTFQISTDETPTTMQATLDTALAQTVIETTLCKDCGLSALNTALSQGGLTVSSTAVSGNLSYSAYKGVSGTTTFCIFKSGAYATVPTVANIAGMPCIQTMKVHFANEVTTPNKLATAHLGMALGGGKDRSGNQPLADEMFLNQFASKSRLTSATKKFGLGLFSDDGSGILASTTKNFINFGATATPANVKTDELKQTITFNANEFYWKSPLTGIQFGTQENSKYGLEDVSITLETGLQCLYVPSDQYSFIYDKITAYSTGYWQTPQGDTIMDCGDKTVMKSISLLFKDKWVEISQADYLVPLRTGNEGKEVSTGMCKLCIKLSADDDWHVGTSALIGYYSEFNSEARTLSLQPMQGTSKLAVKTGSTPGVTLGDSFWTILFLSIANVAVLTILVLLCLAVYFNTNVLIDDDDNTGDSNASGGATDPANAPVPDQAVTIEEPEEGLSEDGITPLLMRKAKIDGIELEGLLQSALVKNKKRSKATTFITFV